MVRKAPEPYLAIQDPKIMMAGKGAPRSTVFGVLGRLPKNEEKVGVKSLGGLIQDTKAGHSLGAGTYMSEKEALRIPGQTERHILGPVSKTRMPGMHYSQIPYPGYFMKAVGPRL
jgi:hypothetical protein